MDQKSYTTTFTVQRSAEEVFAAINDVRAWWTGEIDGRTDAADEEFTYRHGDLHRSTQKITEHVPARRVVWRVVDSHLSFVADRREWQGSDIVFEIEETPQGTEVRFTHEGLVPSLECYSACSGAWAHYVNDALFRWIATGEAAQPGAK